jgi:hypothetical protein
VLGALRGALREVKYAKPLVFYESRNARTRYLYSCSRRSLVKLSKPTGASLNLRAGGRLASRISGAADAEAVAAVRLRLDQNDDDRRVHERSHGP